MSMHSIFLLENSKGQRSLVGYSPWGHKESDVAKETQHAHTHKDIRAKRGILFKHEEEAEFAGWEGPWGSLPSSEAELQRTVQVSPNLSPETGTKFSCPCVLTTVESRVFVTSCCSQYLVFRKTRKRN